MKEKEKERKWCEFDDLTAIGRMSIFDVIRAFYKQFPRTNHIRRHVKLFRKQQIIITSIVTTMKPKSFLVNWNEEWSEQRGPRMRMIDVY